MTHSLTRRAALLAVPALAVARDATAADADPALAYMLANEGVWKGTFRRVDTDLEVIEQFPTEIIIRVDRSGALPRFRQTNRYDKPGGVVEVIETQGEIRDGRAWFANGRVEGWSMPSVPGLEQRMGMLFMRLLDGSGLQMHEVVSLGEDGTQRARTAQYVRGNALVRRTLIDEKLFTRDWAAYERERKGG